MPTYDNIEDKTTSLSANANNASNWTTDDIRKSDILVFRESATEYVDTVVAPNGFQVGLLDEAFLTDLLVTGHITGSGVIYSELGFSGSLQTLIDGSNYLVGAGGISITNNANGSITISGSGGGGGSGSRKKANITPSGTISAGSVVVATGVPLATYSYSDQLIDVFLNGDLLLQGSQSDVNAGTADFYTETDVSGNGQLKFRYDITNQDELILIAGTVGSGGGGGGGTTYTAGQGMSLVGTQFRAKPDATTIGFNSNDQLEVLKAPGTITSGNGINTLSYDGSGNASISVKTVSGGPVTVTGGGVGLDFSPLSAVSLAGSDEVIVSKSGAIGKTTVSDIVALASGGSGAPTTAAYLVATASSDLSAERVLAGSNGISVTDGGANNQMTISAVVKNGGGIEIVTGGLAVKIADFIGFGLTDNGGQIDVNLNALAGTGLMVAGNKLAVDFSQVASPNNEIEINAGDGLALGGTARIGDASSTVNLEVRTTDLSGTGLSVSNNNLDVYLQGSGGISISAGSTDSSGFTPIVIDGSGSGGGGAAGIIGTPEDGAWDDGSGLWNDFTDNTPTGTAIDRINEFLKGLAPSAAGSVATITTTSGNGVGARVSFGSSNAIGTHNNVTTLDNLASLDVNGNYTVSTNTDQRLGAFGVLANVQGVVNGGASGDGTNYPPNAFGNANLGTLRLEVNGAVAYTLDLTDNSTGAGTSGSGSASHLTNGTGFYNVSAATSGKFSSGESLSEHKHRTGSWQVGTSAQRPGWNYVKVLHVIGSTTYSTNHVQWLNDVSGASSAISISSNAISGLSLTGSNHLSGVEYYTGGTLTYACVVGNFYQNVYGTTSMEVSSSQCQNVNVVPGAIDTSSSEDENKTIAVSENLTINSTKLLNESISVGMNVPHPLKSNIANGGSTSVNNILLFNIAESNTDTLKTTENFNGESFRLKIGSYATQANVTSSSNDYDSTVSLVGNTGLQVWNQRLVAPIRSTNSGDFSAIGNGPSGNPDYSGLTTGSKYYYRKFTNNTGGSTSNFTLVIQGTGTIVSNGTTLDGDKIQVFLKLPGPTANTTGWMDISIPFQTNNYADNDGCLVEAFDSSLDSTILGTIGTKFVENNEHIVIKIVADGSWTGHISELRIIWR